MKTKELKSKVKIMQKKTIVVILIIITITITIWFMAKGFSAKKETNNSPSLSTQSQPAQNEPPKIVSTKPDPLNDGFVSGADPIEITFNRSIENIGEFKNRIEPKIEYKVELINDRKTAKIIPTKPWPLGSTFTLYINPDTKFDGVGNWGQDKTFQFRTIRYTGV